MPLEATVRSVTQAYRVIKQMRLQGWDEGEECREAAREGHSHMEVLRRLAEAEAAARYERSVQRRTQAARLPVLKTLEQFDWSWPRKINRVQVQDLFRLRFVEQNTNVVFIGGVGLGKTHLAVALAHTACLHNVPTLFAPAVDIVNTHSRPLRRRTPCPRP